MKIFDIIKAAGYSVDGIAISGDGTVTFSPDYPADPAAVQALVLAQWDAARLEDTKARALAIVRNACEKYILAAYPITRQLNIVRLGAGYVQADLGHMTGYIDEARVISNGIETQILAATTIEEINSILAQAETTYVSELPA